VTINFSVQNEMGTCDATEVRLDESVN